jgi:hypothetical protein
MLLAAKAADLVGRFGILIACAGIFVFSGVIGLMRIKTCKQ